MRDWEKCPWDISHEFWCEKMKQFMEYEERLADLPFHFIKGECWCRGIRALVGGLCSMTPPPHTHFYGKSPKGHHRPA